MTEFVRYAFCYYLLAASEGQTTSAQRLLRTRTVRLLVELYERATDSQVRDVSDEQVTADSVAGCNAFLSGTTLWLTRRFNSRLMKKAFYRGEDGSLAKPLFKVLGQTTPKFLRRWHDDQRIDLREWLPKGIDAIRLEDDEPLTIMERIFEGEPPRQMPFSGLLISAVQSGTGVVYRGPWEKVRELAKQENDIIWMQLCAPNRLAVLLKDRGIDEREQRAEEVATSSEAALRDLSALVGSASLRDDAGVQRQIGPMYEHLRDIHRDYLEILEETLQNIRALAVARGERLWDEPSVMDQFDLMELGGAPDPTRIELLVMKEQLGLITDADREELGLTQAQADDAVEHARELERIADEVSIRRLRFEPIRRQIQDLGAALADLRLSEQEAIFVASVLNYFPVGAARGRFYQPSFPGATSASTTTSLDLVRRLRAAATSIATKTYEEPRFDVAESPSVTCAAIASHIERTLAYHRQQWDEVTHHYHGLLLNNSNRKRSGDS